MAVLGAVEMYYIVLPEKNNKTGTGSNRPMKLYSKGKPEEKEKKRKKKKKKKKKKKDYTDTMQMDSTVLRKNTGIGSIKHNTIL